MVFFLWLWGFTTVLLSSILYGAVLYSEWDELGSFVQTISVLDMWLPFIFCLGVGGFAAALGTMLNEL